MPTLNSDIMSARVRDEDREKIEDRWSTLGDMIREVAAHAESWDLMREVPDDVWMDLYAIARLNRVSFGSLIKDFHMRLDTGRIKISRGRLKF